MGLSDLEAFMLDHASPEYGAASYVLVAMLMGFLAQKGHIETEELLAITGLAASGLRKSGNETAAKLIETTFVGCADVDAEETAARYGITLKAMTRQ